MSISFKKTAELLKKIEDKMSTQASITYKRKSDNMYVSISIHRDGEIGEPFYWGSETELTEGHGTGSSLIKFFNSYKDAEELVMMGNLSSIDHEGGTVHAYSGPTNTNIKEPYGPGGYGESWFSNKPQEYKKLSQINHEAYNYVFEDGRWYVKYRESVFTLNGAEDGDWVNLDRFFKPLKKKTGFSRGSSIHGALDVGKDSSHDRILVAESVQPYLNEAIEGEITYTDENTAYYSGQSNNTAVMYVNKEPVGAVDYVLYNGELSVSDIIVKDELKRNGIGSRLMKYIKQENPDYTYRPSMQTEEGSKFKHKDINLYENEFCKK